VKGKVTPEGVQLPDTYDEELAKKTFEKYRDAAYKKYILDPRKEKGGGGAKLDEEDFDKNFRALQRRIEKGQHEIGVSWMDLQKEMAHVSGDALAEAFWTSEEWFANYTEKIKTDFESGTTSIINDIERLEKRAKEGKPVPGEERLRERYGEQWMVLWGQFLDRLGKAPELKSARDALSEINVKLQQGATLTEAALEYHTSVSNDLEQQLALQRRLYDIERSRKLLQSGFAKGSPEYAELEGYLAATNEDKARRQEITKKGTFGEGFALAAHDASAKLAKGGELGIQVFTKFTDVINNASDSFTEMCMTGKANFGDLAQSVVKDIYAMMLKWAMMQALFGGDMKGKGLTEAGGIVGGLLGLFKGKSTGTFESVLGGPGSGGSVESTLGEVWTPYHGGGSVGMGLPMSTRYVSPEAIYKVFHFGGEVGMGTPMPTRNAPVGLLPFAPRLHAGLAPDEYPAILQSGERVLKRGESAAPPQPIVNIINKTPTDVKKAKTEYRSPTDGKQMILDIVLEGMATDEKFNKQMKLYGSL
jgi:hypothetical protein